jgi:hypothetical protein
VSDIALMFVIVESKAPAGLADIHLLACDARERIYASCVIGSGAVCVLGRFEMLGNGVVAPEGYSYICVLEEVSDFFDQGGGECEYSPFSVVGICSGGGGGGLLEHESFCRMLHFNRESWHGGMLFVYATCFMCCHSSSCCCVSSGRESMCLIRNCYDAILCSRG